jgi:hypothetical protein
MSKKEVNVGGDLTAGRDVVITDRIRDSFNRTDRTNASRELIELLRQLGEAVAAMAEKLPPEKAEDAVKDYGTLAAEAVKAEPRRKWYQLSVDGLKEAAAMVGAIGEPVIKIVAAILAIKGLA